MAHGEPDPSPFDLIHQACGLVFFIYIRPSQDPVIPVFPQPVNKRAVQNMVHFSAVILHDGGSVGIVSSSLCICDTGQICLFQRGNIFSSRNIRLYIGCQTASQKLLQQLINCIQRTPLALIYILAGSGQHKGICAVCLDIKALGAGDFRVKGHFTDIGGSGAVPLRAADQDLIPANIFCIRGEADCNTVKDIL